jgi:16S rRNA (guanine527-N7)-methyltransferase
VKQPRDIIEPVADWLGIDISDEQLETLIRYADWLATEGVALGGIGPGEVERVWDRHIADSLVFGTGLWHGASVLDVGSGLGLPGIPLAISQPGLRVTLLDRSQRRTDALHRVVRMLDLRCTVSTGDIARHHGTYDRLVMRAVLRGDRVLGLRRLVAPGGSMVIGVGRRQRPSEPDPPASLLRIGPEVLENGAWLLIIPQE